MKLVFDTETTGLGNCRLVQVAGILVDKDWVEQTSFSFMVKPDGFEIPAEAAAIHRITTERATAYGIPLRTVLSVFNNSILCAEEVWAFNAPFDFRVINDEFKNIGQESRLQDVSCAMKACQGILQIPNPRGGGYKWPKLAEAYAFFFDGAVIEGAHDALADVRATVKVIRAIEDWREAKDG